MKIVKILLCSISLLLLCIASPLLASEAMNAEVISKVVKIVEKEGYVAVRKIKLKEGIYLVEAFTTQGQRLKIKVDPKTYVILEPKTIKPRFTISELAQKIQDFGFTEIYSFETEDDGYNVIASNKDRQKVKLFINAFTGKITDSLFNYLR
jgi:hypothetical protein